MDNDRIYAIYITRLLLFLAKKPEKGFEVILHKFASDLKKPIYFISELEGSSIHLTGTIFTSGFNKASILKIRRILKEL